MELPDAPAGPAGTPTVPHRLADERAALRRIAALATHNAAAEAVFACVAEQAARLLDADRGAVCRFEADGTASVVGSWIVEGRGGTGGHGRGGVVRLAG